MTALLPFNTEKPVNEKGKKTFETIESRLSLLSPSIDIKKYIAKSNKPGKKAFSSLEAHDITLDGINFRTEEPDKLADEFYRSKDVNGKQVFASMKEDPDHWALKVSFGKTIGIGWREIWRATPYKELMLKRTTPARSAQAMRFGTAGIPFIFSALHCAVDKQTGMCNIHIDETGFVLDSPGGIVLTPDMYQHTVNELLFKTEFRDWLVGKIPNVRMARVAAEVIRRVSFTFPNALNGYAGLNKTINSFKRPTSVIGMVKDSTLGMARIVKPIGVSVDLVDARNTRMQLTLTHVTGEFSATISIGGFF